VDADAHQVELVIVLLALKITYPERVWLIRGGHETGFHRTQFATACEQIFQDSEVANEVAKNVFEVFDCLPLAATIADHILVVHGGVGNESWTLDDLNDVKRPLTKDAILEDPVLSGVLWSQLAELQREASGLLDDEPGSFHQASVTFSEQDSEDFCQKNGIDLVIRSQQCVHQGLGYSLNHKGRVLRVFSARNYRGETNNSAAILLVTHKRLLGDGSRGTMVRAKVIAPPSYKGFRNGADSSPKRKMQSRSSAPTKDLSVISQDQVPADDTDASWFSCIAWFSQAIRSTSYRKLSK
jgi:diadenosine tetraphosphatase ApaH/serine/threonine PP2A family protein phosphatase